MSSDECTVNGEGYLLAPSGAKVARVHDGRLWLYDKRTHEEIPFTLDELAKFFERTTSHEPKTTVYGAG